MPGTAATSGNTLSTARPSAYIAFHAVRGVTSLGGSAGQLSPARPSGRAGDPDQRSAGGTVPLTTLPGSISAPAPISAPGISRLRVPIRAPSPMRISPMTSSRPSIHQPRTSTSASRVAPAPMWTRPVGDGSVARRAPSPTSAPVIRA